MALSLADLKRGRTIQPPRVVVYGPHGVGKSTLAAGAPAPVGILTEDGLGLLDVPHFPLADSYDAVREAIGLLATEDHGFSSVFIDSLDHLEPLIWRALCVAEGKESIEDFGYGKGYVKALDHWRDFLSGLSALRANGLAVILIAHNQVKRYDSPETDPYDRHTLKLHHAASALVQEWADCVLFANWKTTVTKTDVGFGNKHVRGITTGERLLHTVERPAYLAKNRYSLPDTIPLSWDAFADAFQASIAPPSEQPATQQPTEQPSGRARKAKELANA